MAYLAVKDFNAGLNCLFIFRLLGIWPSRPTNPGELSHCPLAGGSIKAGAKPHMDCPNAGIDSMRHAGGIVISILFVPSLDAYVVSNFGEKQRFCLYLPSD